MTLAASSTGNLFLALAALAGLLILQSVITSRDPWEPLNRRFILGLRVMAMLFAGRAMLIMTGIEFFRFFVLLGATLVPLSVVLLAEGLLRRHAPPWAKIWIMVGTLVFAVLSLWWSSSIDPPRLIGLLVFQFSGFLIGAWLVLTRDKTSLTVAENQTVERLALSSRRVIWVNPLLRWDGFAPKAAGIRAMLPHVSSFRAGHNIAALAGLAEALARPDDPGEKARLMAALRAG